MKVCLINLILLVINNTLFFIHVECWLLFWLIFWRVFWTFYRFYLRWLTIWSWWVLASYSFVFVYIEIFWLFLFFCLKQPSMLWYTTSRNWYDWLSKFYHHIVVHLLFSIIIANQFSLRLINWLIVAKHVTEILCFILVSKLVSKHITCYGRWGCYFARTIATVNV